MITLSEINAAYRAGSQEEKREFLELILPDAQIWFDARLLTSELRPIKRIAELETVTGLDDFEDDERTPNLPERIEALEEELHTIEYRPALSPLIEKEPVSKTEVRASLLVSSLRDSGKDHYTADEIIDFLKCRLPDFCKLDEKIKNIRKVKQDVMRTAKEMFSCVELNRKTTGHHEVRLILIS
jgi:hypothetical protein